MVQDVTVPMSSILISLVIRFIAIFIVLGVLQLGLYVSGAIISRLLAARDRRAAGG